MDDVQDHHVVTGSWSSSQHKSSRRPPGTCRMKVIIDEGNIQVAPAIFYPRGRATSHATFLPVASPAKDITPSSQQAISPLVKRV